MYHLDPARLASVRATGVPDDVARGLADDTLDRLARLAARLLGAPKAFVSLVDVDRQHFAAAHGAAGAGARGTTLDRSFCRHVVEEGAALVIEDARVHPLVRGNPAVTEDGVVAYAGIPITTGAGHVLGTLCVVDETPRRWTDEELGTLADLARAATARLELRATDRALAETSTVHARLVAMLEATPDFVGTATPDGRVEFLNRGGRHLLGLAADADLGTLRSADFHPPATMARLAAEAFPAAARDGSWTGEATLLGGQGEAIPVSLAMVAHPAADADAPPAAYSSIMRDLRERVAAQDALAAREAEHRALLAALPLIVYRVEPRPPYAPLYVSPGVAALGYTLAEWLAVPDMWLRVLHPDDRARVLAETDAALAAGRAVDYEYRVVARDGSVRWIHDRGDFVRGAGGAVVAWQGIMADVTVQHRAEAARRLSEARLQAIFDHAGVGVSVVDDAGVIVQANAAFEEFLGYGPGELVGRYAPALSPAEEGDVTRAPVAALRAGRESRVTVEKRFVRRDGAVRWASLTLSRLALGDGREGVLGVTSDVTDRRHAEEARRAAERARRDSEARVRAALDGGRLGFVALAPVRDAAGRVADFDVVAANGQAGALVGMPEEDLVGQRYGELLPLSRAAGHLTAYARVLETGASRELEVRVRDPRFQAEWLRVEAVALDEDGDGRADGVALMVRDVTTEKRAEREARLLADVTRALAAAPTLAAAAGAALEAMCAASGWEYGEAWLVEGEGERQRLVHGPVWHRADDARLARFAAASDAVTFGRGEGMPGRAWAGRVPVVLPQLDAPGARFGRLEAARAAALRSGVAVPVLAGGEAVAVLTFHTRDPRRMGHAPVALLAAVAAQVGTAVRRKLAEAALAEREARLGLIYNSATDLMFLMRVERDAGGAPAAFRCESVNEAYLAVTGMTREDVVGRTAEEILPPAHARFVLGRYATAVATGDTLRYDEAVALPTGLLTVETTLTPVLDDAGRCTHLLGAARDVSATRRAEGALRESEARFRGVLENLRSVAVQLDDVGRVTFANDALCALTGWTRGETLGADWFARFTPEPAASRELFADMVARGEVAPHLERELVTRDGATRVVAWDNVLLRDAEGRVTGMASVGQDVTERRALEARLATLSEHDELTGLLNRRGFRRLAEHALKSASRSRRHDAVLYLDLDRFKPINDTYGHAAGDEALRAMASVIRGTVREADFGARLGGDEFAVYALGLSPGDGAVLAERLRANLEAHNAAAAAAGRPFRVEVSVGVAELAPGDDLDALLARGDAALYAEKLARR